MTVQIHSLSFLTPGNGRDADPGAGLEEALRLFEFGERAGYDGAWIRRHHLEDGVSSAAVFLAAASQRTRRVELGTAVIPIGYESPFRLAEDLSTVDVLSGGRLQAGLSAGAPHAELVAVPVRDGDRRGHELANGRIARLLDNLRAGPDGQRPRPGLADRLWYGGGSPRSVRWAADHGLNLLTGTIVSGEGTDDFATAQLALIDEYRRRLAPDRPGRVALGRVVVPLDSADRVTRERYRRYAAGRQERTAPARRILFAPDLVGTSGEIAERLAADPVVRAVSELRLELPYDFDRHDHEQILHDVRHAVAPQLGWRPTADLVLDRASRGRAVHCGAGMVGSWRTAAGGS